MPQGSNRSLSAVESHVKSQLTTRPKTRPNRAVLVIAGLAAVLSWGSHAVAQPVRVQELVRTTTSGSPLRGWITTVDLTDPSVEIVVTGTPPQGSPGDAILNRTDLWQQSTGVNVAINANFYGVISGNNADIVGLAVSDGVVISPVRTFNSAPDPAIVFRDDRTAFIGNIGSNQLANVVDAVAGVGPSTTDTDPGTLLVNNGVNTGTTARVDPANRNPRTGVGISQDGTRLVIIVVDGRQSAWSVGVTLSEFADLFIERGCWRALNLDGGDSTSFIWQPPGSSTRTLNRPSGAGNAFRAVANQLGIRYTTPTPTYQQRPIRGAWLRPPTPTFTSTALETNLANMARAGFTDLYIETLFWGVATNNSDVFEDRYPNFDALAETIRLAARYNLRTHAWCESAYWQFQSVGANNFTNNPEWRAINRNTGTSGGDGTVGQIFANLGNPGVQAKMRNYFAELADYPGLWGVQTDYHRYPLDDNTGDSFTTPWSYDTWSRDTFLALYGVDPQTGADTTADALWGRFLSWRRAGITEAANQMHLGINSVQPGLEFSIAMFASAMTNSSQFTKCQDWPAMAANNYVETVVPMAYGSTTTSIGNDIATARQFAAGKRVVAGLATIAGTRPTLTDQLNTIRAQGVESFIIFDGTTFSTAASQTALRSWITGTSTRFAPDFNDDGYVDSRDTTLFAAVYTGTPVPVTGANAIYNLDGNTVIDAADAALYEGYFTRARFGDDGVVDGRDLASLIACIGQTAPITGVQHLYDLDGDGDDQDQLQLHARLTVSIPFDLDANRDGSFNIEDLYRQTQNATVDVNRDGVINGDDAASIELALRASEPTSITDR
jgi:uncharacterized lipoprotein YddW (UPF0748 family)